MAESVFLYLKANGSDLKGESTQSSQGRKDAIEVLSYEAAVGSPRDSSTGMATGRRIYQPIVITKRIDKSSPLLLKALVENTLVDGNFKFFRPNPSGDGTTEQFYTVSFKKGRIVNLKQMVGDVLNPESANLPPLEEVSFAFHSIAWTSTNGGVTHEDTWDNNR